MDGYLCVTPPSSSGGGGGGGASFIGQLPGLTGALVSDTPTPPSGLNGNGEVVVSYVQGFAITIPVLRTGNPGGSYGPVTLQAIGTGASAPGYVTTLTWTKGAVVAPNRALPKGLILSSNGVLTGTLATTVSPGPATVTVKVTEVVTTLKGKKKVKTKKTAYATIPLTIT